MSLRHQSLQFLSLLPLPTLSLLQYNQPTSLLLQASSQSLLSNPSLNKFNLFSHTISRFNRHPLSIPSLSPLLLPSLRQLHLSRPSFLNPSPTINMNKKVKTTTTNHKKNSTTNPPTTTLISFSIKVNLTIVTLSSLASLQTKQSHLDYYKPPSLMCITKCKPPSMFPHQFSHFPFCKHHRMLQPLFTLPSKLPLLHNLPLLPHQHINLV